MQSLRNQLPTSSTAPIGTQHVRGLPESCCICGSNRSIRLVVRLRAPGDARQHEGAWSRPADRQDGAAKSSRPRLSILNVRRHLGPRRRPLTLRAFAASQSRGFTNGGDHCGRDRFTGHRASSSGRLDRACTRSTPNGPVRLIAKADHVGLASAATRVNEPFVFPGGAIR
jgi:hypothetical protein